MRRIPIESAGPIVVFAIARLAVGVVALAAVAVVDFPDQEAAAVVLAVFIAWAVGDAGDGSARARPRRATRSWRPATSPCSSPSSSWRQTRSGPFASSRSS